MLNIKQLISSRLLSLSCELELCQKGHPTSNVSLSCRCGETDGFMNYKIIFSLRFLAIKWEGEMSYPRGEMSGREYVQGGMSVYHSSMAVVKNSSRTDIIKPTSFLCLDTALQAWCFNQSRCFKVVFSESFIMMCNIIESQLFQKVRLCRAW